MIRVGRRLLPHPEFHRHLPAPALQDRLQRGPLVEHDIAIVALGPRAVHIQIEPDPVQLVGVALYVRPRPQQADLLDAPQHKPHRAGQARRVARQQPGRLQHRHHTRRRILRPLRDIVPVVMAAQHDHLVRLPRSRQIAQNVPRGHRLAPVRRRETDPHLAALLRQAPDKGPVLHSDRDPWNKRLSIVTDPAGCRTVARIVVDKDEPGGPCQQAAPVLFPAMDPTLGASGTRHTGRHDNLAPDLIRPVFEILRGAVASIDDRALQVRCRRVRQTDARDLLLNGGNDLQFDLTPDPANILHWLQVGILQSILLHFGPQVLRGLSLPLRAPKAGAKPIAERDQCVHHLPTRIAVTNHLLIHFQKPVSLCHDPSSSYIRCSRCGR